MLIWRETPTVQKDLSDDLKMQKWTQAELAAGMKDDYYISWKNQHFKKKAKALDVREKKK